MEFPFAGPDGPQDPLFNIHTIRLMVALTFFVQALSVSFLSRIVHHYRGLRMFQASALVLALGSSVLVLGRWVDPETAAFTSGVLMLWGTALQYMALARFAGLQPSSVALGVLVGGGSLVLTAFFFIPGPTPYVAIREALAAPILIAAALVFRKADISSYRFGAILTGLPFAGYALLSIFRVAKGIIDPTFMRPWPNLTSSLDAMILFVFSFLWTTGFLLMVNQRLQSELTSLATRDPLTDCLNRRAMGELLDAEQDRFSRYGRPYTVILLDLDRFKTINDSRGHQTGDQVLVKTAQVLREALRTGDTLARWGGEEFLILLPETQEEAGAALAERLRLQVAGHAFDLGGLDVTFSAGVAGSKTGQTVDSLCHRADQALYAAKETRNRVLLASPPPE